MTRNRSGQSTLEYMAVAVLVMVGILGMGPYVIRSVNAYFEGAREQAQDSFREEFRQAQIHGTETTLDLGEDCSCHWSSTYTCGDGLHCDTTIEMQSLVCTPATCKYEMDAKGLGAQCYERTLLEQGRVDYHSAAGCFPLCTEAGGYSDCPSGTSLQSPDDLFGICGYRCCEAALPASPMRCGTGSHERDLLMVRRCGPDLEEQYFWEPSNFCRYDCGVKDNLSTWCDPVSYDAGLDPLMDGQVYYLDYGTDACEQEALDQGCAAGDMECRQSVWRCMADCSADEYLLAKADQSGCECSVPWVWDNSLNMCGCVAAYYGTAIGAGGSRTYPSPMYPQPVKFLVSLWTDDLNFCIKFYDEFDTLIYSVGGRAASSSGADVFYNPTNIEDYCLGTAADSDGSGPSSVDYFPPDPNDRFEYTAYRMSLTVTEGGNNSSTSLGYAVNCERP